MKHGWLFALMMLLGSMSLAGPQPSTTIVNPGPVVDQTWTSPGSPYRVTGDIEVGGSTIDCGVEVLVAGPYEIRILTTISATGSVDAPITFTARRPKACNFALTTREGLAYIAP